MSDIRVLIVVDGIFSLTPTYPIKPNNPPFGPNPAGEPDYGADPWFTVSHLIFTLNNSPSPTFKVDTASRGFNTAASFSDNSIANTVPDPDATIKGPNPSTPTPFHFDDPGLDLTVYDEIWMFGFEGYDNYYDENGVLHMNATGPLGPGEPGGITDSELTAITQFMEGGGGVFAAGDHDGLGAALCGRIPRVRYMRRWYSAFDTSAGIPPLAVRNWLGGTHERRDTLQKSATDTSQPDAADTFYFDDQSDDIPQPLTVLVPSHPVVQGATGVLQVYPDHMHEGEIVAPTGAMLTQTSTSDSSLSFAGTGFTEFPTIDGYQEAPIVLATVEVGTGGGLTGHITVVAEGLPCENPNFASDKTLCDTGTCNTLAAYDGATVNVGRIVTDSSFHHFLDLNLIGDPCSAIPVKQQGFKASTAGKAVLAELEAFYINLATWLAWNRKFYFAAGKSDYGRDEVADNLSYSGAIYLFLEGFTPNLVGSAQPVFASSSTFNSTNIPGLTISGPTIAYEVGHTGANRNVTQRIRFEYTVGFASASLAAFPAAGSTTPNAFTLNASIDIQGKTRPAQPMEFFLLSGEDPYFTNINDPAGNPPCLSQDLRVFTITPTANDQTFANVKFKFQTGNPTKLDTAAGYAYIQDLIASLNGSIGFKKAGYTPPDTNLSDPLNTLLPQQNGALDGDSLVNPKTGSNRNYNFAIARVRLKGSPHATASGVKVFFRVFTTQTFDTDYINVSSAATSADPNVTYPSTGSSDNPQSPEPGKAGPASGGAINGCSLPFFATNNYEDSPSDYAAGGANFHDIEIPAGQDYVWAFYGCFLNVNDATNEFGGKPVQHWFVGAVHSCLVAQIAYQFSPIENANGVIENPGISDKLAQRNLQVTTSGNPGYPETHRVPQTIDVRPSPPPQSSDRHSILSYPDEIMIDWGKTPHGTVARLFWPGLSAASILQLATRFYPTHLLSAADAHTIQVEVASSVSYIPIPVGAGGSFAGLMTLDLPASVRYGNEFDVLVRRIATRQLAARTASRAAEAAGVEVAASDDAPVWRYISGSFLARISVQQESTILPADENLLAILKWRLATIGPSNRWYPVLLRYLGDLSARIKGMGGDAARIPASPDGYQHILPVHGRHIGEQHCHTGKVIGIRYDRFGDFAGFTLVSEHGREHWFRGREPKVEELVRRAWMERTVISVFVSSHDSDWPESIVLDRWQ